MGPALVAAAGVGAFVASGLALRGSRVASSTIGIGAPESVVYELLADLKRGWTRWSPLMVAAGNGTSLEYGAASSGPGAAVSWSGKAGKGSVTLTECHPPHGLSYRTTMALGGMVANGSFELRGQGSTTIVTWTDALSVGSNPLLKWLALAMDATRKRNLERGLAELKRVAEDAAVGLASN